MNHSSRPRRYGWLVAIVLLGYAAVLLCCCVDQQWQPEWDSAVYLLTARSLAESGEYSYLGEPYFLRPPALPWLLSFFVSDGQFDFLQLNRLMMIAAILSIAAVYLLLRLQFNREWALLITLFSGTSPLFFTRFNWVQSEFFFLAFFFPALLLFERGSRPGKRSTMALVAGSLLMAVSIYFRSVGILVLPAVLLVIILRRKGRERLLALLPVLLVIPLILPWMIHARQAESQAPRPAEQSLLFSYNTALFRLDPGDPDSGLLTLGHWVGRAQRNGLKMVTWLSWALLGTSHPLAIILLAAALLAGLVAALARGPSILDFFFAAYSLLLLFYFTFHIRLLLPLVPLLYLYLARGLDWLVRRTAHRPRAGLVTVIATGLLVLLLAGVNVRFLATPMGNDARLSDGSSGVSALEMAEHATLSQWLKKNTGEDDRVLAKMAPILSVLSDRDVYTWMFTRKLELLKRNRINYILLDSATPDWLSRQAAPYIDQRWEIPGAAPGLVTTVLKLKPWD